MAPTQTGTPPNAGQKTSAGSRGNSELTPARHWRSVWILWFFPGGKEEILYSLNFYSKNTVFIGPAEVVKHTGWTPEGQAEESHASQNFCLCDTSRAPKMM
jgi:hypothetical protein